MAEDKSPGVEFLTTTTGFDADGNAVTIQGTAANRVYAFSEDFVVSKDTTVNPNVTRASLRNAAALEARIAALEAMLGGTGTVTVNRLVARYISAKQAGTSILTIQVPTAAVDTYQTVMEARLNIADFLPNAKLGFFTATPVLQQSIPAVSALSDIEGAAINTGLIVRLP